MQRWLQDDRVARRRLGFTMALVVAAIATAPARARADDGHRSQHLTRAVDAIDERDYTKAKVHLKLALEAGQHRRDDTVLIYRLSGEVAASFGQRAAAERFFRHMLAIDPRAEAAIAEVPGVAEPYDAARAYFDDDHQALSVECEFDPETRVVTVHVASDPLQLVAGVRLVYGKGERRGSREAAYEGGDMPLVVPDGFQASAWVTAVDAYGNELTEPMPASPQVAPIPPPEVAAAAATSRARAGADPFVEARADGDGRSLFGRWYVWGVLTLGAAGTAAFYGSRANADWQELDQVIQDSSKYDFEQADTLEQSGHRKALYANVAIGVAATTGLITAILLVRDLRSDRSSSRLSAAPTRGGAAVSWEVGF